jgi:hypothetical protein
MVSGLWIMVFPNDKSQMIKQKIKILNQQLEIGVPEGQKRSGSTLLTAQCTHNTR